MIPTDFQDSYGVGGYQRVPVYDVVIDLNEYVKDIHLVVTEAVLNKYDGGPKYSDIGFLIVMNIISRGDLFVGQFRDNDDLCKTMFSFRFPSAQDPTDYLQEINDYNNTKLLEKKKNIVLNNKAKNREYINRISRKKRK